jgi:hypothetical protein
MIDEGKRCRKAVVYCSHSCGAMPKTNAGSSTSAVRCGGLWSLRMTDLWERKLRSKLGNIVVSHP